LRTKLLDAILKHHDEIRQNLSFGTLPAVDGQIVPPAILSELIAKARESRQLSKSEGGRAYLESITKAQVAEALKSGFVEKKSAKSRMGTFARITAAVRKMGVGGGLAAANVGLGIFTGVVSALRTLGLGTVTAAVGIVTSAYTGLNAGCDGLKDLADALDES